MPAATVLPARAALALCVVLLAGVMGCDQRIEASTQAKPHAVPEPASMVPPVAPPMVTPIAQSPVVAAIKNEPLATVVVPASTPGDPGVTQLRSRDLTLPVQGVNAARLTDTYTQARAAGAPHEALDIMAERGTPVLAVEDGEVVKLFLSKPGGITLYQFDPARHYAYYYAHLDSYAEGIREGTALRKGQVIGYVGSTGNALPGSPHLHFAIFVLGPERQWWKGAPLNPFLVWREP